MYANRFHVDFGTSKMSMTRRRCHKKIYNSIPPLPFWTAGLLQNRYDYFKSVTAFFRVFLKKLRFLVKSVHIRRKINLKFVGAVH